MFEYMWAIWLGVFLIAILIEALGPEVVSIWFGLGAVVSLIISFIPGCDWWIQIIVFFVISLGCFLALRPLAKKFMKKSLINSNVDEMIHKKGVMIKKADSLNRGEVKINGIIWTAISQKENEELNVDDVVEVVAIEGNKLVVTKI